LYDCSKSKSELYRDWIEGVQGLNIVLDLDFNCGFKSTTAHVSIFYDDATNDARWR